MLVLLHGRWRFESMFTLWRYWYAEQSSDSAEYEGTVYDGTYNWKDQDNPSKAVFGNITYPIAETFRLTVGGRYTADEEEYIGYNPEAPDGNVYSKESYDSSHTDYKLGFEYDLDENVMVWADFSTGYKHVFRNAESQELKAYQLGAKTRLLNQKLQINATSFYYDYRQLWAPVWFRW